MSRPFPIHPDDRDVPGPQSVPWAFLETLTASIHAIHDQTLERLADRGGLAWAEIAAHVVTTREGRSSVGWFRSLEGYGGGNSEQAQQVVVEYLQREIERLKKAGT